VSWLEVASFIGLGVVSNTVFPMPFEPILVAFSGGRPDAHLVLVCLLGSLCAGTGALVDAGCFGLVRRKVQRMNAAPAEERRAGPRFYLFAAAAGLLPIPFTLVRAGLLQARPRPFLFAGIVAAARYPRYLVTVYAWSALSLPAWAGWVLAGLSLLAALEWRHATRRERAMPAARALAEVGAQ
jgi:membrane protein YqaA with SNARE-associated domain